MTIFHLIDAPLALPALTPVAAASASSLLTLAYVGNLYVSTATRIGKARSKDGVLLTKDDAVVVRSRLRVASWTTVGAWAATLAVVRRTALRHVANPLLSLLASLRLTGVSLPVPSVLHGHALPFQPSVTLYTLHHVLPSILVPLALTSVLFAGPLIVSFLDGRLMGQHRGGSWKEALHDKLGNIWGLRNYLVGPLTEEVVFRGCVLALHALAGVRKPALVFATPLYFGFAHVHHAYESYVNEGRTAAALRRATLRSLFQFTYTCVFGWYANFLFLRTNSLLAPMAAHVFCNIMGLPDPAGAAARHPGQGRKWAIYGAHLLGIAGFAYALFPWTKPGLFGGSLFWW